MSVIDVDPAATIVVRWTDATGPMHARFGPEIPWAARVAILTMGNDDWGEIYIKNPDEAEFLWCSAKSEHRGAAREAIRSPVHADRKPEPRCQRAACQHRIGDHAAHNGHCLIHLCGCLAYRAPVEAPVGGRIVMAAQVAVHLRVDQLSDIEARAEWFGKELHIPIGPLHLVLGEAVAKPFTQRLEALVMGREQR